MVCVEITLTAVGSVIVIFSTTIQLFASVTFSIFIPAERLEISFLYDYLDDLRKKGSLHRGIEIENGQGVIIYNDPEDVMHDMKHGSIKDQIKDQLIQINAGATEAIKEMGGKLADEIEVKE